jgi:hypothetical protein
MEGHELSEFQQGNMSIRSHEWPDFSAPLTARRYPVVIEGANNTSGGAGGGGGAGSAGGTPVFTSGTAKDIFGTATLSADTDNWNTYTPPNATVIRLTVTADCKLSGIIPRGVDGQLLTIENVGPKRVAFYNNDSSTPADTFLNPQLPNGSGGNIDVAPHASITYRYNLSIPAWTLVNLSVQ